MLAIWIALGIIGGVLGLVLIFMAPRLFITFMNDVLRGNIAQMAGKMITMASFVVFVVALVRIGRVANAESFAKAIEDPFLYAAMGVTVLGGGLLVLGNWIEERAGRRPETKKS